MPRYAETLLRSGWAWPQRSADVCYQFATIVRERRPNARQWPLVASCRINVAKRSS